MVTLDDTPDYNAIATRLDRLRQVPADVLTTVVVRGGLCFWRLWPSEEPDWDDCAPSDRELAARLCTGCPVIDQCLDLDLRTAGADATGVWVLWQKTTGARCTRSGSAATSRTREIRKEGRRHDH